MKARFSGLLAAPVALGLLAWACIEDPVSDLDTGAAYVVFNADQLDLSEGDTVAVTASVLDGRGRPLPEAITFTACDADLTVAADPSYDPVPPTSARAIVVAAAPGASCVVAAGGGVSDTLGAVVLPVSFGGALSSTTPQAGAVLSIQSTAALKFNPANAAVTFGGGIPGTIAFASADSLRVIVPFSDAGPLTISGINVTYVAGLEVSLASSSSVTQTGDFWGTGDTSFATAPTFTPPAAGTTAYGITDLGPARPYPADCFEGAPSTGPCVIYKFTLAAATALTLRAGWDGTGDIDIYVCTAVGVCGTGGFGGAGVNNPEQMNSFTYPAGTYFWVIERFGGTVPRNIRLTMSQP